MYTVKFSLVTFTHVVILRFPINPIYEATTTRRRMRREARGSLEEPFKGARAGAGERRSSVVSCRRIIERLKEEADGQRYSSILKKRDTHLEMNRA